jgi:hypothetical protein
MLMNLTERECASLLGGLIGSLINNSSVETVRNAIRWWAETDEAWEGFQRLFDDRERSEATMRELMFPEKIENKH